MADCGCGGSGSAAAAAAESGQVFTILLANRNKVGRYPTRAHADVALRTQFKGQGTVVPR